MKTRAAKQLSRVLMVGAAAILFAAAPSGAGAAQEQSATAGAAQQSERPSDLSITQHIRRAVVKDKSLSTEAHNVTIITKDGKVTLKGRVRSEAEKQTVETAATNVAGQGNVNDQLTTSNP